MFQLCRQELARNIKNLRYETGIEAVEISKMLNMSVNNYYRLESGEQAVKAEWLVVLSSLFEVTIDELFYAQPNKRHARLESQIMDYCKKASEQEMIHWLAIMGIAKRNNVNQKQYKAIIVMMDALNAVIEK